MATSGEGESLQFYNAKCLRICRISSRCSEILNFYYFKIVIQCDKKWSFILIRMLNTIDFKVCATKAADTHSMGRAFKNTPRTRSPCLSLTGQARRGFFFSFFFSCLPAHVCHQQLENPWCKNLRCESCSRLY